VEQERVTHTVAGHQVTIAVHQIEGGFTGFVFRCPLSHQMKMSCAIVTTGRTSKTKQEAVDDAAAGLVEHLQRAHPSHP